MSERFVRRNRVDERIALAIAAVGGIAAALAGAEPTGRLVVDALIVFVAVGAVVLASASAPWWAPAVAAGAAAAIAVDPKLAAIGGVAFGVGLYVGLKRRHQSALRAGVAAVAMNVMIRSALGGFLGFSAIISIGVGAALFVVGMRRRPSRVRRMAWTSVAAVGGTGVLALLLLAVSATSARPDITRGAQQAGEAISALDAGEYATAADLLEASSDAFTRSDSRLGGILTAPSRLVPGVAQNVRAGADLSAAAAAGTARAAVALRSIDPDTLSVVDGRIDLAAVAELEEPLQRVRTVLDDLRAATDEVDSPWLIAPVQDNLADLHERLGSNAPRLDNAIDAVNLAPQILGADAPRRYLVLFTTPVEARGLAGFMGNYAVITADQGAIDVTDFGRRSDLEAYIATNPATCTGCPQEFLDRYGRFGFVGADASGGVGTYAWTAITLPAHFPYVGEVSQILFPQSGGDPIDGVISMDPYVIQALMRYTGAVEVPELGLTVNPDDAAQFILREQYDGLGATEATGNEERIDALETIGTEVISRLLRGSLPAPPEIAADLGPLVAEQRLLFWTDDPDEQALFGRIGLLGAMPALGDDGGFGVMVSNAGHSKIDLYLRRSVEVNVDTAADGARTLVADVTLTNTAPASGLPDYVIGNEYGFPSGTSWLWVNFFGPGGLGLATRNGEQMDVTQTSEAGWQAYERYEELAPGASVSFRLEFQLGPALDGVDEPVTWTQPLSARTP